MTETAESQRRRRANKSPEEIEIIRAKSRETYRALSPEKKKALGDRSVKRFQENKELIAGQQRRRYKNNPWPIVLSNVRLKSAKLGIPFNLTIEDVISPEHCPVFGFPLVQRGRGARGPQANSPSIDRIIPDLGYVKGNVIVVSMLANAIKQNANPEQIRRVADFYDALINQGVVLRPQNEIQN